MSSDGAPGIDRLREQIRELDELHRNGTLSAEAHGPARAALEAQLLDLLVQPPAAAAGAPAATAVATSTARNARTNWIVGGVMALAAVGVALWLTRTAAPEAAPAGMPAAAAAPEAPASGAHAVTPDQMAAMVDRLAARLAQQPDDPEGWAMLARSYAVGGQHVKAIPAFRKAVALKKDDAVLLADFADALAMTQDRRLSGEPITLVKRALVLEPGNLKALSLAGTEAFDRKDYKAALEHWEKLRQLAPPDSVFVKQILSGISEARQLAGLAPQASQPAASAAVTKPGAGAKMSGA